MYSLVLLLAACGLVVVGLLRRSDLWRVLWSALAAVVAAFALAPIVFSQGKGYRDVYSPPHMADMLPYGCYRLVPNQSTRWQRYKDDALVFDTRFTADGNGLRISPPAGGAQQSILFTGCSYTFGHGVNDEETFPYRVGVQLRDQYASYNFGFNGDGPHSLLARIRAGFIEPIVKQPPKLILFTTLYDHVRRVTGRRFEPFRQDDPMYRLAPDGSLILAGRFRDRSWFEVSRNRLIDPFQSVFGAGKEDIKLYLSVLRTVRDEFKQRYPQARFEVLYWPIPPDGTHMDEVIRKAGFSVHSANEFLPGGFTQQYQVPKDGHPNALAHRLAADFVVSKLVAESN